MSLTGIGEIADAAKSIFGPIINNLFPDKTQEEKDQIALQMQQASIAAQAQASQNDTNKIEAASSSLFVAGWRPMVGWVCGTAFAVQFVFGPLGTWIAALIGHPVVFPTMDFGTILPILLGMLGLGVMRTSEKIKGVDAGH
jgi:hypothetical protein